MATPRRRTWSNLGTPQQHRYLSAGRKQGLTEQQIITHYESGGSLSAWRGHTHPSGISEKSWAKLKRAAKAARLDQDIENPDIVLESLIAKGFSVAWILRKLAEKKDSRDTYRTWIKRALRRSNDNEGWQPGQRRFQHRVQYADIELYWYH